MAKKAYYLMLNNLCKYYKKWCCKFVLVTNFKIMRTARSIRYLLFLVVVTGCVDDPVLISGYKTENIVVIVMDGPRYSETGGDSLSQHIPFLGGLLSKKGVINTNFYNNGVTKTIPGHTAIMTGNYQEINNGGDEIPLFPSIFQYWIESNSNDSTKAWVISSKDKLEVLANSQEFGWEDKYNPLTDCGISGLGSGYRHDSITYRNVINVLNVNQPQMLLVNFREPDYSGHKGDWDKYLAGITEVDNYISKIWNYLERDPNYSGRTTLFVTNDHGRHLDNIVDGFVSHGDNCDGCRHIFLYADGPDFKEGYSTNINRELIDIPATIGELIGVDLPNGSGIIMTELFK
jgi:hypothetical protein